MQQVRLKWLTGNFAAPQQVGDHRLDCGISGCDFELWLLIFFRWLLAWRGFGLVKHDGDQGFGFDFRGCRERNCRLHNCYAVGR